MREILFRAKGQTSGKWYEGLLTRLDKDVCYIKDNRHDEWICDSETVCQYIGFNDKNGKKIFEGDIVQYCDCTVENYVIAWDSDKALFEYRQYGCSVMNFDELSGMEVEIIGNIFDNPELIGE